MISGALFRRALAETVKRPFRVKPFFDPGPWGGQWMREVCNLPDGPSNYAWCFDCVPEENSLVFEFGGELDRSSGSSTWCLVIPGNCWAKLFMRDSEPSFLFGSTFSTRWRVATYRCKFIH